MATASERFVGYIIGNEREEFLASVSGDPDYIGLELVFVVIFRIIASEN